MQNFRYLLIDEKGVSPVIGVILMVAVTVIIAAVIGATVFRTSNEISDTAPQAQIEISQQNNYKYTDSFSPPATDTYSRAVIITHGGGDDIDPDEISVTIDNEKAYAIGPEKSDASSDRTAVVDPWQTESVVTAGDKAVIFAKGPTMDDISLNPINKNRVIMATYESNDEIIRNHVPDPSVFYGTGDDVVLKDGQTVRIIWESSDEGSQILATHEIS